VPRLGLDGEIAQPTAAARGRGSRRCRRWRWHPGCEWPGPSSHWRSTSFYLGLDPRGGEVQFEPIAGPLCPQQAGI